MLGIAHRTRPVIGILLSHIDGSYQQELWKGLHDFCQQEDCDLIIYASRLWRGMSTDHQVQECVYHLVDESRIDALCIESSAFTSEADCNAFLDSKPALAGIPRLFISMRSNESGIPSLCPDDAGGIAMAIHHLVEQHACKTLAYVGGPEGLNVAQQRLSAFQKVCQKLAIDLSAKAIVNGGFTQISGRRATIKLLDQLETVPDAIVYANDNIGIVNISSVSKHPKCI